MNKQKSKTSVLIILLVLTITPFLITTYSTAQLSIPAVSHTNIDYQLGNLTNFNTRRAGTLDGNLSAQYIYSYLSGLNLTVNYDYFDSSEGVLMNIIVDIPSNNNSEEIVIIGAHYDTINVGGKTLPAPGANDNGASIAILLELCRILGNYTFNRNIKIIFFGGEEIGRIGSLHWIQTHEEDLNKILVALILDMVAYDDKLIIDYNHPSYWMGEYIQSHISVSGLDFSIENNNYLSDQTRFWDVGVTALLIHHDAPLAYSYYHSASDTVDKLNMSMVYLTAEFVLKTVFTIGNDTSISVNNSLQTNNVVIIVAVSSLSIIFAVSIVIYYKRRGKNEK
ncbi:MAG: M28 family metallopeptidase [Candidatus Odinarchaeia archaeon]